MNASAALTGGRALVFDTGPLWELVLYLAVRDLKFERLRGDLIHLRAESSYRRFTDFVAVYGKKTTTPHVVAEISSKITRTERRGQSAIWRLVYDEFLAMRMDESVLKLLEMPPDLVSEIGAVDVSVLRLGSSLGRPKSIVISTDERLIAECRRAGVDAQDMWEVIAG